MPPAGTPPARRSCVPPSSGGGPAAARTHPTAGNAHLDPPARQVAAAAAMVVGLVGVNLLRPAAPPAGRRAHRRQVVQQRLYQAVVGVGPGHQHRQRQPAALNRQCSLDPRLARSTGFAPTWSPLVTRRLKESTLTRDQSSPPAPPSSSSCSTVRSPRQMARSPSSTRSRKARSGRSPTWAGR